MKPETETAIWHSAARIAGLLRPQWPRRLKSAAATLAPGISVVIPSRNGRDLLAAQFPGIASDLAGIPGEIIVVDNGSNDGTAAWLAAVWPQARVEVSTAPLSFARAVNRGIALARHSHICLLNNDMIVEPGFFTALRRAFCRVPDLFCATAQIFFPPGVRREETGKAVFRQPTPEDFPIWCDEPLPGEDLSYVLYGSGGCSLYDTLKLHALGDIDEAYDPVYVEDLDIGYRGWQQGWPSVYVAGARVEHRHRATSSRYYTETQLEAILEINYLRFVARAVAGRTVFRRLWEQALDRLRLKTGAGPVPLQALRAAPGIALHGGAWLRPEIPEEQILALTNGSVAVFPGRSPSCKPVKVVSALEGVDDYDVVLVIKASELTPPAPELLARCVEVVLVSSEAGFPAAFAQSRRKWRSNPSERETDR